MLRNRHVHRLVHNSVRQRASSAGIVLQEVVESHVRSYESEEGISASRHQHRGKTAMNFALDRHLSVSGPRLFSFSCAKGKCQCEPRGESSKPLPSSSSSGMLCKVPLDDQEQFSGVRWHYHRDCSVSVHRSYTLLLSGASNEQATL